MRFRRVPAQVLCEVLEGSGAKQFRGFLWHKHLIFMAQA